MEAHKGDDRVLRAMTDDGAFRVITARTTDTVAETLRRQEAAAGTRAVLGELVTGAILVRETMAPKQRLQAIFRDRAGGGTLVADTHPDGGTRGLVQGDAAGTIDMQGGTLEMMRTLYSGELHRGFVEVPSGGGMSQTLMTYMASSEQVASMIAVGCVMDGDKVQAAGGYIVQLLPEVGRSPLETMTERLKDFEQIDELLADTDAQPEPLLETLLAGMKYTNLDDSPLGFRCRCTSLRVMTSLATLGRQELTQMIEEGKVIDLSCEYCGQEFRVGPTQLRGLLEES